MPPELLTHILESIPSHPFNDHVAILASLCLVNHHFLQIARPLLYRQIQLDFDDEWTIVNQETYLLSGTLATVRSCLKAVRNLHLSFCGRAHYCEGFGRWPGMLMGLGQLDSISASWEGAHDSLAEWSVSDVDWDEAKRILGAVEEAFIDGVIEHQADLKCLELAYVEELDYGAFLSIFAHLTRLETFVVDKLPFYPYCKRVPLDAVCHLRRLVLKSAFEPSTLQHILRSSQTSLTSLAFPFDTKDLPLDLSCLSTLSDFHLSILPDEAGPIPADHAFTAILRRLKKFILETLRPTLNSLNSLPLNNLSIATECPVLQPLLKLIPILDLVPPSLARLQVPSFFFEPASPNDSILFDAIKSQSLPCLRVLSVSPSTDLQNTVFLVGLREKCRAFGIELRYRGERSTGILDSR